MTNEQIIERLLSELPELAEVYDQTDINDSYSDYLAGTVNRTQMVLLMLGVDQEIIDKASGSMVEC